MSGINKVILVGYVGKDLDVRVSENDVKLASFPLVTSEIATRNGVKAEVSEWHQVVVWRGLVDVAEKIIKKGKLIYIEGKLRKRQYIGRDLKPYSQTEIIANHFTLLGRSSDNVVTVIDEPWSDVAPFNMEMQHKE